MHTRLTQFAAVALGILCLRLLVLPRPSQTASADAVGRIVRTGDMTVPRFDHTATLLPNGKVLIAAGMARNGLTEPTAELYDPSTGRFSLAGKLASPRGWGSTATLVQDGKVLIVGGASGSWCSASCYLATAELYDPTTNTFTRTASMTEPRAGARAILLKNGDVLIVGGNLSSESVPTSTAELYHPSTGTFSRTGSMQNGGPTALVLLKDGRVLALGSGAELYDPSSGRFSTEGNFLTPRGKFGAVLLRGGRVLVAGGQVDGARGPTTADTEIYNPATEKFTVGPELNLKRYKLMKAIVALNSGEILVAGGADQPELYNPVSRSFHLVAGSKLDGYCFSTATLLPNGDVLLVGGYNTNTWVAVNHAWLYQP